MIQYGVAALVKGITINGELRLVLNHFWASESAINYDAVHRDNCSIKADSARPR